MNKHTLALLGDSRSGTTAMWYYLPLHKQIIPGRIKEQLQRMSNDTTDFTSYIKDNFTPTKSTQVFLEGTPNLIIYKPHFIDMLIPEFSRVCCIYAVKPPLERLYSYNHILIVNHFRRTGILPYYIREDLSVDHYAIRHMMLTDSMSYRKLRLLEKKLGIENLYVFNLRKLSESVGSILKFLGVDQQDLNIQKINRTLDHAPTIDHLRITNNIQTWVKNNQEFVDHITQIDKERINKRYGDIL